MLDLAIIGSGPAALTAATYSARFGFSVEVYERNNIGGALTEIANIENFPGYMGEGKELAEKLRKQTLHAGATINYGAITSVKKEKDHFVLNIDGEDKEAKAVLVATGSEPKPLPFVTEKPVSYCALCDAPLYKDKNIAVIGGGNSAVGESLHLAEIVKTLTLFSHSELRADAVFIEKLRSYKNVKIIENIDVTAKDLSEFDGVFVFIGKRPASTFLPQEVVDDDGYIKTNDKQMTKIAGLFAAGDVRCGTLKQAITAAADGASAAISIKEYLRS